MREIEIKLKVPSIEKIAARLQQLGSTISQPIVQTDITFVHKDDTKWFENSQRGYVYPRLRMQDGKPITLTVKRPLTNEGDSREHELHIDNAEEWRGVMDMLGFRESMTVVKSRRTAKLDTYSITLDEVKDLGSFIEIEQVVEDGDPKTMQQEMIQFANNTFDIETDALILRGYDVLLFYKQSGSSLI